MTFTESMYVLHVDDDPYILDLTSRFLHETDDPLVIESTTSVEDAGEILETMTVDCVVCDHEALRDGLPAVVREHDAQLPILLFTAEHSYRRLSEALAEGVTDFMRKERDSAQYQLLANRIRLLAEKYRVEQHTGRVSPATDCVDNRQPSGRE